MPKLLELLEITGAVVTLDAIPADADPQDVRYNVIQWVHRSTRGWSYGSSVTDPRTGQILKGHVSLGALRVRQDVRLAEGLLSPYAEGEDDEPRAIEMALARIRQLSAHEIGHTLGLTHNFAASTDWRASVMDYPAPLVGIDGEGRLDLSDAYRDGCGEWDEVAIRYGYSDFTHLAGASAEEKEAVGLRGVLADADAQGLDFLTDRDARGAWSRSTTASRFGSMDFLHCSLTEPSRRMFTRRSFGSGNRPSTT